MAARPEREKDGVVQGATAEVQRAAPAPGHHEVGGTMTVTHASLNAAQPGGTRRSDLALRVLGVVALAGVVATVWLGLWVTPPDRFMGNLVRLLYVHPPMAWVAFLAYGVAFLASLLYLWPRTRDLRFDRVAGASAEVGVVFTGLTLLTGSIWGRPTWGTWWTWDPLLTTTALLFVLYLGYLALRQVPGDPEARARRSAIGALVAFVDVPIVYFSVDWWRSLHQAPTISIVQHKTYVHGSMAWTLLLGFCAFTALYGWLVGHRYRLAGLVAAEEQLALQEALVERRAEVGGQAGEDGGAPAAGHGGREGDGALAGAGLAGASRR